MGNATASAESKKKAYGKHLTILALLSLAYLLLSYLLVGFKTDQLILVGLSNLLYFLSNVSRKFITGFSIFIVYWVLYDYMKAFPNYWFSTVHIQDLYELEKSWFGITDGKNLLTSNEFWQLHSTTFLDVMSGFFYLAWVPVPMGFAVFLFFRNRRQFIYFSLSFLLINLLGFVVYYIYPAAPPWYVQQYGFEFNALTPGSTAGLVRFDTYFNMLVFNSLYAKGSNVFAAMPSLHSAYPLLVVYYAFKNRLSLAAKLFSGIIMTGIWFAAVYTSHHYVLDVLAGIICALSGILLFNMLVSKSRVVNKAIEKFVAAIT